MVARPFRKREEFFGPIPTGSFGIIENDERSAHI